MTPILVVLGVLAALAWSGYLATFHPPRMLTVALVLSIGAQTSPGLSIGVLPRLVLGLSIATAMLTSKNASIWRTERKTSGRHAEAEFAGLVVLLGISLLSTNSISTTVSALTGTAAVLAVGIVLGRTLGISMILDQLFISCFGFLVASVVVAPLSFASEADRLRGVLENANMLGAVAALSAASSPQRWIRYVFPLAATLIYFSGSRASAIAFVIIAVFRFEWRSASRLALLVVVPILLAGLAAGLLIFDSSVPEAESVAIVESGIVEEEGNDTALLRTRDNRTARWEQGIIDARNALPSGIGFGTARFEYASSPVLLIVETGVVAIPISALTILILVNASRTPDRRSRAMFAGFAVHALFEGWMFAFGSALAVTFWLVAAASVATQRETGERAIASARALFNAN